jgi:endoglucanase
MQAKLGAGINMSNVLEVPGFDETGWGEAAIEQRHLAEIAAQGFNSVRIPVTWEPHVENNDFANGKISDERMDRVQQVVDWALAEGLYVIVNTHHERGFGDSSLYRMIEDGNFEGGEAWISNIWGQIADRFQNYCERLIFEPMNEPHLRNTSMWIWENWNNWPFFPIDTNLWQGTNHLNEYALNVIRDSHPNHEKRVIITTIPGGEPAALRHYVHPNRIVNGVSQGSDTYSAVGIYFYSGYDAPTFSTDGHEGAWELIRDLNNGTRTYSDINDIYVDHNSPAGGIPVVVRETSPCGPDTQAPNTFDGDRAVWSLHWYSLFADEGIPCLWWNPRFGTNDTLIWPRLWDRPSGAWANQDLGEAFFEAFERMDRGAEPEPEPEPEETPEADTAPDNTAFESEDNEGSTLPVGLIIAVVLAVLAVAVAAVIIIVKKKK